MFLFDNSAARICVILCINIVVAEWPRHFPDRSPQDSISPLTSATPHRHGRTHTTGHEPTTEQTLAPSQENGVATTEAPPQVEGHRLAPQNLEDPSSSRTDSDLLQGDDPKPRLSAGMPQEARVIFAPVLPTFAHNSSMHLDLLGLRELWARVNSIQDAMIHPYSALNSRTVQSLIWPLSILILGLCIILAIVCSCCCLKRPIYCCGRQLCDYSHDSATNHRQTLQLRQDAEHGREHIELTNIPLNTSLDSDNKHGSTKGAKPKRLLTLPAIDAKCTVPTSSPLNKTDTDVQTSTLSLVRL